MLTTMEERCAGIDVGKRELAVTVMTGPAHQDPAIETRAFGTTNRNLQELRDWLVEKGCTAVVIEYG